MPKTVADAVTATSLGLGDNGKWLNPVPADVLNAVTATSLGMGDWGSLGQQQFNLTVTVNNNTGGLADAVVSATQDQSANGIPISLIRSRSQLNW